MQSSLLELHRKPRLRETPVFDLGLRVIFWNVRLLKTAKIWF